VILRNTDDKKLAKTVNKIMKMGGLFKSDMYIVTENRKKVFIQAMLVPVQNKAFKEEDWIED